MSLVYNLCIWGWILILIFYLNIFLLVNGRWWKLLRYWCVMLKLLCLMSWLVCFLCGKLSNCFGWFVSYVLKGVLYCMFFIVWKKFLCWVMLLLCLKMVVMYVFLMIWCRWIMICWYKLWLGVIWGIFMVICYVILGLSVWYYKMLKLLVWNFLLV